MQLNQLWEVAMQLIKEEYKTFIVIKLKTLNINISNNIYIGVFYVDGKQKKNKNNGKLHINCIIYIFISNSK